MLVHTHIELRLVRHSETRPCCQARDVESANFVPRRHRCPCLKFVRGKPQILCPLSFVLRFGTGFSDGWPGAVPSKTGPSSPEMSSQRGQVELSHKEGMLLMVLHGARRWFLQSFMDDQVEMITYWMEIMGNKCTIHHALCRWQCVWRPFIRNCKMVKSQTPCNRSCASISNPCRVEDYQVYILHRS